MSGRGIQPVSPRQNKGVAKAPVIGSAAGQSAYQRLPWSIATATATGGMPAARSSESPA